MPCHLLAATLGPQIKELRGRLKVRSCPRPLVRGKGQDWFDVFQPRAEPGPRERGYDRALAAARPLLALGVKYSEDPEFYYISECTGELDEFGLPDDYLGFTREDLPELMSVPRESPTTGEPYSQAFREEVAGRLLWGGAAVRDGWCPRWLGEAMLADILAGCELRLVAVPKQVAVDYVAEHHSKLPNLNLRGLMYAIGIVSGERLVAVATAGTPTGRWERPERVLELTRVASDRTVRGAASMLVARLIDLLPVSSRNPSFPALLVTYSLVDEAGTTYRALSDKGLRPTKLVKARAGGGARQQSELSLSDVDKIRWEAGVEAGEADWTLLRPTAHGR